MYTYLAWTAQFFQFYQWQIQEVGENGWGSVPLNLNTDSTPLWRDSQSKILAESTGANTSFLHIFSLVDFNRKKIFSKVQTSLHRIFSSLERLFLEVSFLFDVAWVEGCKGRCSQKRKSGHTFLPHMVTCSLNPYLQLHTVVKAGDPKLLGFVLKQKGFPSLCHYPVASILVQAHLGLICMVQRMAPLRYLMTIWSPEYQVPEK